MLLKICLMILLIVPCISYSQTIDNWKLYSNKKQIASAQEGSVPIVQIHKNDTAALQLVLNAEDTAFKRRVIVMNEQRNGIDSKDVPANANDVVFDVQHLLKQSGGKSVVFYLIRIPADPVKAALVRVAPLPIFHLQWVD